MQKNLNTIFITFITPQPHPPAVTTTNRLIIWETPTDSYNYTIFSPKFANTVNVQHTQVKRFQLCSVGNLVSEEEKGFRLLNHNTHNQT